MNPPDSNPKSRYGIKKPPLHLIPSVALIDLSVAMALGAKKYGAYNWREKGVAASVYLAAAERHLRAYLDGEDTDAESGASHLGHVMACCAIIADAITLGKLIDDRPTKGMFAAGVREFASMVERGELPAMQETRPESKNEVRCEAESHWGCGCRLPAGHSGMHFCDHHEAPFELVVNRKG